MSGCRKVCWVVLEIGGFQCGSRRIACVVLYIFRERPGPGPLLSHPYSPNCFRPGSLTAEALKGLILISSVV